MNPPKKIKKRKRKHRDDTSPDRSQLQGGSNKEIYNTQTFPKNRYDSSSDEDEMTVDQLGDRNQALREGLRQQLQIFE